MKFAAAAVMLVALLGVAAAQAPYTIYPTPQDAMMSTSKNPAATSLSTFKSLMSVMGNTDLLTNIKTKQTIFAPSDAAFKALDLTDAQLATLAKDPVGMQILKYHIVAGAGMDAKRLGELAPAPKGRDFVTAQGEKVNVAVDAAAAGRKLLQSSPAPANATANVTTTPVLASPSPAVTNAAAAGVSPSPAVANAAGVSPSPAVAAAAGVSPSPAVAAAAGVSPSPAVAAVAGVSPSPAVAAGSSPAPGASPALALPATAPVKKTGVTVSDGGKAGPRNVVLPNLASGGTIIHVIDAVLVPPSLQPKVADVLAKVKSGAIAADTTTTTGVAGVAVKPAASPAAKSSAAGMVASVAAAVVPALLMAL